MLSPCQPLAIESHGRDRHHCDRSRGLSCRCAFGHHPGTDLPSICTATVSETISASIWFPLPEVISGLAGSFARPSVALGSSPGTLHTAGFEHASHTIRRPFCIQILRRDTP